jgi:hypothetical protein
MRSRRGDAYDDKTVTSDRSKGKEKQGESKRGKGWNRCSFKRRNKKQGRGGEQELASKRGWM